MKKVLRSAKEYLQKCDLTLLAMALIISCVGLAAIYSAAYSYHRPKFLIVQGAAAALGVCAYFVVSLIDLDRFGDLWPAALVLNLLMLFSLRFLGEGGESTGNNSWIRFGPIGVQPAELGKIIFVFTFSRHIYSLRDRMDSLGSLAQLLAHALVTAGFVYLFSDDLGMCVVYIMITVIMLFASGLPMKLFAPLCLLGGASLVPLWRWFLKDYHKLRILVLFDPEVSARIAYNGIQSMIAVGGGGLFGYGFLKGPQTQYSVLPAKHTDFIFASIAEEEGFIGAMLVIVLLSVLVWRVFWSASQVHDRFSFMMCVGIGGMLMSQILINVGMCLGVMPVIGITLPLISYGGTSVVTTFAALGLVCGVKMRQRPERLL